MRLKSLMAAALASCAVLTAAAGIAAAKPPTKASEVTGPTNAALVYARAWIMLSPEQSKKFSDAYKSEAGWTPDPDTAALLEGEQGHINAVMRAAAMPECDWGIDYDRGFEALIPHVGLLRRDARMLDADAARLALQGDSDAAAQRIVAMLRMSGQCGQDGILISSLVGTAICKTAQARAGWMIDQGKMSISAARTILEAARAIPADDAFGAGSSIAAEGVVLVESARLHYTGPDAGKRFIQFLSRDGIADSAAWSRIEKMDGDQLVNALEQAGRYYKDAKAVWNQPDGGERLTALAGRLDEYGPMASIVAPSLSKSWRSQAEVRASLDGLITRLEQAAK